MGQFFQLKYVVMYGWSSFLANLDNVSAPPHPKCIGRIHLYSDMWRYFDNGLYLFMQQYIYLPVIGQATSLIARLCASAVCFSFVYVWHGTMDFVLIWSCLNFIGITCEGLARAVGRHHTYQQWESYYLGHLSVRRLQMKKTIKAHQEKKTKQSAEAPADEGAVPAYLLDREQQTQAKVISNMVKQKRKEKAGKW